MREIPKDWQREDRIEKKREGEGEGEREERIFSVK
jgi:hypothetical protein